MSRFATRCIISVSLWAWALAAAAAGELNLLASSQVPRVTWSGYATLGYVNGGDDTLIFTRELSQQSRSETNNGWVSDSRLGLQANIRLGQDWEGVVQWVARDKVNPTLENSTEWAFVSYRPTPEAVVRVGRVALDLFALSDFRSVGYAYHWVRPPSEFYAWLPIYSVDGVDLAASFFVGETRITPKISLGQSRADLPGFGDGGTFRFDVNALRSLGLTVENGSWRARASHSSMKIGSELPMTEVTAALGMVQPYWPQAGMLADELTVKGSGLTYSSVGLGYDDGRWQVSTELSQTTADKAFLPAGRRAYLSVGRRWEDWLPFVSYAYATDPVNLQATAPAGFGLEPLAAGVNAALSATRMRQNTVSVGVRWDFASRMALKLQADRTQVEAGGSGLWLVTDPSWRGGTRSVWSATLDLIF